MVYRAFIFGLTASLAIALPVCARPAIPLDRSSARSVQLHSYLQCVPYARRMTGIHIYGDAHTWWGQAANRYVRGEEPRVGAVMAIQPHGRSRLGHVAAVTKVINSRTILISHANWSVAGEIEKDVEAVDVSADNNWSEVRIWHGPSNALGAGHWPLYGFIYNKKLVVGRSAKLANGRLEIKRAAFRNDPVGRIIAATLPR